jgi:hypothetical protein
MRRFKFETSHVAITLSALGVLFAGCSSSFRDDCTAARSCAPAASEAAAGAPDQGSDTGDTSRAGSGSEAGAADIGTPAGGSGGETSSEANAGETGDGEAGASVAAAGEGGAVEPLPPRDTTPPTVLSVSPADGASGVQNNAKLIVTFSEPMDQASADAAYQSADLAPANVSFDWNGAGTILTITPKTALAYQTGTANADGSAAFAAKKYGYGFGSAASDLAGNPLANATFSFNTLRQVSHDIPAEAARSGTWSSTGEGPDECSRSAAVPTVCMGYIDTDYDGFLSFVLPTGIVQVISANLVAHGSRIIGGSLGPGANTIEHLAFGTLGDAAFTANSGTSLDALFPDENWNANKDVTAAVTADNLARAALSNRTQYRIKYHPMVIDSEEDVLEITTSTIKLSSTYLVP